MTLNNGYEYAEQIGARWAMREALTYLVERYVHSSEAEWRERFDGGLVTIDGKPARPDQRLKPGQRIAWRRPPWDEPDVPLSFAVLHRDEDLLAVAKPAGLPTAPAGGFLEHTLFSIVRKRYPGATPVHRLGRGTSGIVLFALSARGRSSTTRALRLREAKKTYRALISGRPVADAFAIDQPIGPVPHPILGSLHAASKDGKEAKSLVKVLERRQDSSVVEVEIETGRAHQIRIHLAFCGHPLVGDPLYGPGGIALAKGRSLPGDTGYFLHAERLSLPHPSSGATFEAHCMPPPVLRVNRA